MRPALLRAALIAAAVGLLYAPTLRGSFVSDDIFYVALARRLAALPPGELAHALLAETGDPAGTQFYRPLTFASLVADFGLWGTWAAGWRLTSLLLHLGNALALGALTRTLAGSAWAGVLAALLLALHPASPEAVAWIAARADPLAGLWILLAMLAFACRGRRRHTALAAVAALAAALLSKEPAVVAVPALLVLALVREPGPLRTRAPRALAATRGLWLVLALYFAVRVLVLGTLVGGHHYVRPDPLSAAFWSARAHALGVLLAPVQLEVLPLAAKPVVLALVAVALAGGAAAALRDPQRRALLVFGGAWLALALVPAFQMDIDPVNLFGARVLYEATAALAFTLAVAVAALARAAGGALAAAAAACLLATYALLAPAHLRYWVDAGRLGAAMLREVGGDPAALLPHQGTLVRAFHGEKGQIGAARGGMPFPALAQVERSLAAAAAARLDAGDDSARQALAALLLARDREARRCAIDALARAYGERRGYEPDAPLEARRAAAARWR